jgi:NAD-dependent deacetylase
MRMQALDAAEVAETARRIAGAARMLVLTGAGVSAESGVPTFRGPEGLWRQRRPEELATHEAFARDPGLVWEWYAWRREVIAPLRPNAAHDAISRLEERAHVFLLATQNVDGLHQASSSRRVVELHGSLWRLRCTACAEEGEDRRVPLPELPPRCSCGGLLRPAVVWFGESLPEPALRAAFDAGESADVVLVIGTSSVVYPAAAIAPAARARGAFVVEVNPFETPLTALAHASFRGPAGEIVPSLLGAA